ncbi:MAG: phosphatidylserine decarboxylase [Chloroflexota bacterium]
MNNHKYHTKHLSSPQTIAVFAQMKEENTWWSGELLLPNSDAYQKAVPLFNKRVQTHPSIIIRPRNTRETSLVLKTAWANGIKLRIRGGGHSDEGYSSWNGGAQLDTRLMKGIEVFPQKATIKLEAGVLWREVYERLDHSGFVVTGGLCPSVGVIGYITGGGLNHYLSRHWGMCSDNAESFTVVLFDGTVLEHVSKDNHADLWWALRGGGGGNFGVVTDVILEMHPAGGDGQDRYPLYTATYKNLSPEHFGDLIDAWAKWTEHVMDVRERRIGSTLEYAPDQVGTVTMAWSGGLASEMVFQQLTQVWETIAPHPTTTAYEKPSWLAWQQDDDMPWDFDGPFEQRWYGASSFVTRLTPQIRDLIVSQTKAHNALLFETNFEAGSAQDEQSSFAHRRGNYLLNPLYFWDGEAQDEAVLAKGRRWMQEMVQLPEFVGAYINYIDGQLENWPQLYYGRYLPRLQQIKAKYDPHNYWHFPQAIPPLTEEADDATAYSGCMGDNDLAPIVQELIMLTQTDAAFCHQLRQAWLATERGRSAPPNSLGHNLQTMFTFFDGWLRLLPGVDSEQSWDGQFTAFYQSPIGKQLIAQEPLQGWLKRFVQARADFMNSSESLAAIPLWQEDPRFNMARFQEPEEGFASFNDFFIRKLKPSALVIENEAEAAVIVSPADCTAGLLQAENGLDGQAKLPLKGERLELEGVLGRSPYTSRFKGGTALYCHLSPLNYHRWHAPINGRLVEVRRLGTRLWPVEGAGSHNQFYGENNRSVFILESDIAPHKPLIALVAVGNSVIGSVNTVVQTGQFVKKGQELGFFAYGGSAIALLFEPNCIKLAINKDGQTMTVGEQLGRFIHQQA